MGDAQDVMWQCPAEITKHARFVADERQAK